jgi:hypothetical protein
VKIAGAVLIEESEWNEGSPSGLPDFMPFPAKRFYSMETQMKSIIGVAIGLCGLLLISATSFADGERRYEAIRIYSEQDEQCVFILDTKVGYVWTWERKKIGDKSFTTLQYWGMVEIGKKMGDIIDTTLPKRLKAPIPKKP